jgi:hypothetical protein
MKSRHRFAIEILSVLLLPGCWSTTNIRTYRDMSEAPPHSLRVMTVDTTLYEFTRFSFTDSLIEGEGEHLVAGRWLLFSGQVPMSRIVYIQSRSFDVLTSLVGLGVIGLTAAWFNEANAEEGLRVWRPYGGGGSCPYVYAWDGSRFVREGEAFGTALGKGLETSTGCVLPDASAPDGILRVRIADERPETHYINSVRVCAYEAPRGTPVYLDTHDRAWPLPSLLPPLRAPDAVMRSDDVRWASDTARRTGGYRDTLEILLPRTATANEGSLVVHAINTHIPDGAFAKLFGYLGDESLPYLYRMEHDSGTIALLKGWIDECALHIDVWDGACWKSAGLIPPEANDVPFTRIVRIPAPERSRDSARIRLRVLADTWEIDAVAIDWSPALPLQEHVLPLLSAGHSRWGSVDRAIRAQDSEYAMLLPGESLDMTFRALEPREGYSMSYACHASGYLYEWLPEGPVRVELPELFPSSGVGRMKVADFLLGNHKVFLPLLFARSDATGRTSR